LGFDGNSFFSLSRRADRLSMLASMRDKRAAAGSHFIPPVEDLPALSGDLGTHSLDFGSDLVKLHAALAQLAPFRSARGQPLSADLPIREGAIGAIDDDLPFFAAVHRALREID
jgi:hypothetical protein